MRHKTFILASDKIFALQRIPDAPSARSKEADNQGAFNVAREYTMKNWLAPRRLASTQFR